MRNFMRTAAVAALAVSAVVAGPALAQGSGHAAHSTAAPDPAAAAALDAALASSIRGTDGARDAYRHPRETLNFFEVKPGQTVVDFMPSGGWFTRVLVPYLGANGTYVGLNPKIPADATGFMANMRDTKDKFPKQASEWATGAKVIGANVGDLPEDLTGKADRVLIFREIHNMWRFNWLRDSLVDIRALLKDDGLVGVEQHRAPANASADYTDGSKGYLREKDVIALFEAHGFDHVASSEVNANPKDPANWPNGVWTLAPSFGGATDETRPKLAEIGESDRMTLLFRKRP